MEIYKKIKTFIFMNNRKKVMLFEAFIFLGWARILKTMPFSKMAPLLGTYMDETSFIQKPSLLTTFRDVSDAIYIMSGYTPWESRCLVRAIAGLKMLQRRHIASTLYLGTAKDETGTMIAHAWLRSGSFYITGVEEMNKFTVVGRFASEISEL